MKRLEYKIIFEPSGRQVFVLPETILLEAAALAGFILQTPCGGVGKCAKCRIQVTAGHCAPSAVCSAALSPTELAEGWRLACQAKVSGDLTILIPSKSLFETHQQILTSDNGVTVNLQPAASKHYCELDLPNPAEATADVARLRAAIHPNRLTQIGLPTLRALGGILRQTRYKGTAVLVNNELIDFEPGNTEKQCYGIALDLGTTTLVGTLIDLKTGAELAVGSLINPQTSYGDDVISRIRKCRTEPKALAQLQRVIISAINDIIDNLTTSANVDSDHIYELVLAGNTAMQQIACGIDPAALGELPFAPAFSDALQARATEMNLDINPNGLIYVFPQIGGFVGGDTVAGIIASHLDQASEPTLFVDIGSNGEIVLAHDRKLIAASVAAGPAFEGARISCGMRAVSGAIEKVILDGDLRINVIGNLRPAGLCGSGLIDTAAELLRAGILNTHGRILTPEELPENLSKSLRKRLLSQNDQMNFMLAQKTATASGEPLLLTQKDIRELQLANAAIRAGINIILRRQGLQFSDISRILLAGGFGNFIRRNQARRIGLLPPIPCRLISFIGNSSSMGAKLALLSVAQKQRAAEVAAKVQHLDLSLMPEFQDEFSTALIFPETDLGDCETG